ncbi:hypothetical protein HBI38_095490 [Parastagonospora nodorum]|nr:hypothetical protein HBH61_095090 [Parastagonospora nodorum]KAH4935988.1 hypothetical protein HBI79_075280 [Parastagonospora nodorum]KAH5015009.1 hypothetical protein HBI74_177600 [Parastagonospora nodorum]KAH5057948.1 hypothetical protein HBH96_100900 [Parastagonospora nodorum]KAH5216261.1 hypothetical protein HBI62_169740 [Parastagonospora nodorum]
MLPTAELGTKHFAEASPPFHSRRRIKVHLPCTMSTTKAMQLRIRNFGGSSNDGL